MGDVLGIEWDTAEENLGYGGDGGSCWCPVLWSWPSHLKYVDGSYIMAVSGEEIGALLCTCVRVTGVTALSSSHWGGWVEGDGAGDATNINCHAWHAGSWDHSEEPLSWFYQYSILWHHETGYLGAKAQCITELCFLVSLAASHEFWTLWEEDTLGCTALGEGFSCLF